MHAGAGAADCLGVGEGQCVRVARGVLMNRDQAGYTAAFGKDFAHAMTRGLGGDHADIDLRRRDDGAVANVEAVGEHQRLALAHVRRDVFVV